MTATHTPGPKVIKRAIPADLIDAIYKAEGWKKVEGECRTARCKTLYDITRDNRANRYVATRRAAIAKAEGR